MASRAFSLKGKSMIGAAVAALILGLYLAAGLAVAGRATGGAGLTPADWAALRFTLVQAVLSALVSVALAVPVARALARRRFVGRRLLISLLGAPFILPVIVAILGLLAVFGRGGIVNDLLTLINIKTVSIYGLQGVVLGHVFFNMPLAVRILLMGWQSIPAERFRLLAGLNGSVWTVLERPMLREVLPGAFAVIFLICLSSFAVALTLGGGPGATTIEVAIYQAISFEFDLAKAAGLASLQGVIGGVGALVALFVALPVVQGAGLDRTVRRWDGGMGARAADAVWIALAASFLLLPLTMVVLRGAGGLAELPVSVFLAWLRTMAVAVSVAALTPVVAFALAARGGALTTLAAAVPLAVSGLVVGTGLFILINPVLAPSVVALPVTALLNTLVAVPFALRVIAPALGDVERSYGALAASLGLRGMARLRIVQVPRMRRALGFSAGLAGAMAVGDLGVIVLFAGTGQETLPLLMYRLMGAYRMEAAAAVALILLATSLLIFWVFDRGGRGDADA